MDLYWPSIGLTNESKVYDKAFDPSSSNYKNRNFQCNFVKKILNTTKGKTQEKFSKITQNGKICIASDLPRSSWNLWTTQLMNFFWSDKWIPEGSNFLSLEDLILLKRLNQSCYE